jgi:hypothetical protein
MSWARTLSGGSETEESGSFLKKRTKKLLLIAGVDGAGDTTRRK